MELELTTLAEDPTALEKLPEEEQGLTGCGCTAVMTCTIVTCAPYATCGYQTNIKIP